ncbi:MAG TPA: adenosylcobinamide-GDP ribazoletransferase [Candidatus Binatia bacterium]|nr:adenosylcobinamide-GDP ribazoletransferase [Candidatus Binatia bacterium]
MKRALAALQFLTLLGRFNGPPVTPREIGRAAAYFPLVGIGLGVGLSVFNRVLEAYLASEILSIALVTTLAIATGAIHLEGLQRTFDRVPIGARFGIKSDSGGNLGLIAVVLVVLFKVNSLEAIGEARNLSLVLAPTLARWGLVIFLYGSTSAVEEPAKTIAAQLKAWQLILATVIALGLTAFMAGRTGLWIALWVSLFALLSRTVVQRHRAGPTYHHLGALVETNEALSLVAFTIL